MNEKKFEQVEKLLYRRSYKTAHGNWSTGYYAVFKCHDGKRRWFPVGDNLKAARDGLTLRLAENLRKHDFDAEKQARQTAKIKTMTLSQWLDQYLELVKTTPSYSTKKSQCAQPQAFAWSSSIGGSEQGPNHGI